MSFYSTKESFQKKDDIPPPFQFSWRKNETLSDEVKNLKISDSTESLPALESEGS